MLRVFPQLSDVRIDFAWSGTLAITLPRIPDFGRIAPNIFYAQAMVVVQEIAPQILPAFVKKFNEHVPWTIEVAEDGRILEQGVCYVCSNEKTMSIDRNESDQPCIRLEDAADQPLNALFRSAAEVFKNNTVGVLLTGVGDDGADGFARIRELGGSTIAQDSQCCVYPNLTQHAIERGTVSKIVDETQLPDAIVASIA